MSAPTITTHTILALLAQQTTGVGRIQLLATKVKTMLTDYVLADTLEKITVLQQGSSQLPTTKYEELKTELELVLQQNPNLVEELSELLHKEANNDAMIGQLVHGNLTNNAYDQATIISGPVTGGVTITHDHQNTHNHGDMDVQVNNSKVSGDINVNKPKS